jgi:hypothetical protein
MSGYEFPLPRSPWLTEGSRLALFESMLALMMH